MSDITRILEETRRGEPGSVERLTERLYTEMQALARREMQKERADHTLNATALVHELYLRLLAGEDTLAFQSRAHFFGAAATAIRRLLVEHARARERTKRGGGARRVELDEALAPASPDGDARILALEAALERFAKLDAHKAKIVELRFFAGLSVEEGAALLVLPQRRSALPGPGVDQHDLPVGFLVQRVQ